MPSEKILTEKQAYVAALKEKIANSVAGVVVDYKGINVADDTKLRKELREAGVEYFVVKNTMLRLAISGTELEGMNDVLEGTTALAIAKEDRIAAARILCKYSDAAKDKFNVKVGYMDGKLMDKASVEEIAKLPGISGFVVGPNDFTMSMNTPERTYTVNDPEVQEQFDKIGQALAGTGKLFGVSGACSEKFVTDWIRRGVNYMCMNFDFNYIVSGAKNVMQTSHAVLDQLGRAY